MCLFYKFTCQICNCLVSLLSSCTVKSYLQIIQLVKFTGMTSSKLTLIILRVWVQLCRDTIVGAICFYLLTTNR